jgi:hypothetical protein
MSYNANMKLRWLFRFSACTHIKHVFYALNSPKRRARNDKAIVDFSSAGCRQSYFFREAKNKNE